MSYTDHQVQDTRDAIFRALAARDLEVLDLSSDIFNKMVLEIPCNDLTVDKGSMPHGRVVRLTFDASNDPFNIEVVRWNGDEVQYLPVEERWRMTVQRFDPPQMVARWMVVTLSKANRI